jgi:hypothetical protein
VPRQRGIRVGAAVQVLQAIQVRGQYPRNVKIAAMFSAAQKSVAWGQITKSRYH